MNFTHLANKNFAVDEAINIYVRDVDGDDANSGLESTSPLKTLGVAFNKIPRLLEYDVMIHVGPHSGSGYVWPANGIRGIISAGGSVIIIGDGGGGGTDGKNILLGPSVVTAGNAEGVTTGDTYAENDFKGHSIEVLDGDAEGDIKTVTYNAANGTIVPAHVFTAAVDPGDTIQVFEPEVVILGSASYSGTLSYGVGEIGTFDESGSALFIVNVKFTGTGFISTVFSNTKLFLNGVEFDPTVGYCLLHTWFSQVYAGWSARLSTILSSPNVNNYVGWAISSTDSYIELNAAHGLFLGYIVCGQISHTGGQVSIYGGVIGRVYTYGRIGNSYHSYMNINLSSYAAGFSTTEDGLKLIGFGSPEAVRMDVGGWFGDITVAPTSGHGIIVVTNGRLRLTGGTGNSPGIGLQTQHGGQIRLDEATSITGTTGDFSEDGGTTLRSNAVLTNGSAFVDGTHLSKIYRRDGGP